MQLQDILYHEGFGTRRVCCGLVQQGHVQVHAQGSAGVPVECRDPFIELDASGLRLRVMGQDWECHSPAFLMLHKPPGTECSQKPSSYPSVYSLLPSPLRMRPHKGGLMGVQAVGRLDQDTTGLLLLTDDGAFIHRMSSPRHRVPKVYEVTLRHPLDEQQLERLRSGVVLDDDPHPVHAAAALAVGSHHLRLTLLQGKYHQVKRMVAAVGNRVEALHRSRIGSLDLPHDLAPGQWRWLTPHDLQLLRG